MKDYYITMESMFFVVKLYFHLAMQTSSFSYHELHTNKTKTIHNQKLFKILNFHSHKPSIHIITLYKMKGAFQGLKHLLKY